MTDLRIDLVEYLVKPSMESDVDLLQDSLKMVVQLLMEADVSHQIGANKYERTSERSPKGMVTESVVGRRE